MVKFQRASSVLILEYSSSIYLKLVWSMKVMALTDKTVPFKII